jgi:hypothetical protein
MRGLKGSPRVGKRSAAATQARRGLVLRYYLIGLGPEEIASRPDINADPSTIYRDLDFLREDISKKIEARKLWPIKRHILLQEELMRQCWQIFYRPREKRTIGAGKNVREIELDDSFRRLFSIDRIHKISKDLARLAFPEIDEYQTAEPDQIRDPVRVAVKLIEGLPIEQRDKIINTIRCQVVQETATRPA